MTKRFEKLQAELAAMKPRALSSEVIDNVAEAFIEPRANWADRFLVGAMSVGSLAACFIVAMLLLQNSPAPQNSPPAVTASAPRMGDVSLMLARADSPWAERLK